MMPKFQRFVSRHRWALPVFFAAAIIFFVNTLEDIGLSPTLALLLLPFLLISFFMGTSVTSVLMLPALKALEESCDPYPLLDETTYQLTYVKNKNDRALLTVNHAAALIELGQTEKAHALLCGVRQTELLPMPNLWVAYYANLAVCELEAGQIDRVHLLYEMACKQLEEIKKPKEKAPCTDVLRLVYAELQLAHDHAEAALPELAKIEGAGLRIQVSKAWLYARIARATGDTDTTRQNLAYVLANGNRLHVVQQAKELMEKL